MSRYGIQKTAYSLTSSWYGGSTPDSKGHEYIYVSGTLQGYWPLDDNNIASDGIARDISGCGRNFVSDSTFYPSYNSSIAAPDLQVTGSALFTRSTPDNASQGGRYLRNANGNYWDKIIGNNTTGPTKQKFTVSVWIHPTDPQTSYEQFIWSVGGEDIAFYIDQGVVYFQTIWKQSGGGSATQRWQISSAQDPTEKLRPPYRVNQWTHLAVSYNANSHIYEPQMYVNGERWNALQILGAPGQRVDWYGIIGQYFNIGSKVQAYSTQIYDGFQGKLSNFAIWNDVLSDGAIKAIYNAGYSGAHLILRDYYNRGSSATLSGSLMPFRQGVSVLTMEQRFSGMSPKMAAGSPPKMLVDGKVWGNQSSVFDDSIQFSPASYKITSGSTVGTVVEQTPVGETKGRISFAPNHEMIRRDFGQPKLFKDDEPFEDMPGFNPVTFIYDGGCSMIYPYILFNVSMRDPDQMDGVIEPLAIRSRASRNSIDWPHEAHDVSGYLMDGAEDSRGYSCPIMQQINLRPTLFEPFEDGTLQELVGTTVSGSIRREGFLHNSPEVILPFVDSTDYVDAYKHMADVRLDLSEASVFKMVLTSRTGSIDDMNLRDHKSSTAGFEYLGALDGTDSIAFGGLKK
jgi:hypothetical protein